ncbi:MAG: GDSL-type esterase/lipase family protein [Candidatus Faecousia sp.]|nr:GDSL-type esterase/lipase family protein [Clostridiales bacterium]MDY6179694.1 GDSL-type esterase/lipase family protein [Candidatus Faecousia sp.]
MKEWIPGWGCRETDFSLFPIYAENETQRLWFYNNLYSDTLRLRFSNRYGRETLPLEQVSISRCTEQGRIEPETSVTVRFCGKPGVRLEPGQVLCCDPVEFHAEPGTWISVSLYIKEKTRITCAISSQSLLVTGMACQSGGNFCLAQTVAGERFLDNARYFMALKPLYNIVAAALTQVEFLCENAREITTVTVFGDSITQHGNWSEALTRRLYAAAPGRSAVVNRGICGNRVLHDASIRSKFGGYFGEGALERFEEDVYGTPGNRVDCVILEEGINDIIQPFDGTCPQYEKVTAQELLSGYRAIARLAHAHGSRLLGATIMPFRGFNAVWNAESEQMRLDINRELKREVIFDTLLDFAAVVADPEDGTRLAPAWDCGDHLHPNAAGGQAIADSVELANILKGKGETDA